MRANEFVKEFGWDRAKREVALIGTIAVMCGDNDFNNDLKRLVEAREIIKLFKSLDHAKAEAQACEQSKHSEILVKLDVGVGYIWLSRVKQAIADVESYL